MKLISKEFFTLLSLILLLAPFSFAVYSQNLDDDFLQGLPLDVQKRLEIGNEEEGDDELDKLLSTKSSIEKNEALLELRAGSCYNNSDGSDDQDEDASNGSDGSLVSYDQNMIRNSNPNLRCKNDYL